MIKKLPVILSRVVTIVDDGSTKKLYANSAGQDSQRGYTSPVVLPSECNLSTQQVEYGVLVRIIDLISA